MEESGWLKLNEFFRMFRFLSKTQGFDKLSKASLDSQRYKFQTSTIQ